MPTDLDLWLVEPDSIDSAPLLAHYRSLLTTEERDRGERLYFIKHRHDYLITRALCRVVLAERVHLAPHELRFGNNEYGRPFLTQAPDLSFNISHTDGLIVLAVANEGVVGVDVERFGRRQISRTLAGKFFAPSETAWLRNVDPLHWEEAFLTYWTLKEAYIKACGLGLSLPLDSFEFDLAQARHIGFHPASNRVCDASARFCLMRPSATHRVAVCARVNGPVRAPKVRRIVPLVSEQGLDISMLRYSHADLIGSSD